LKPLPAFVFLLAAACAGQETLSPCQTLYENREFARALDCARRKLDSGLVSARQDSLRAFELAAVVSYILEDFDGANAYFDRMLRLDSRYQINPVTVPPEITALFENRRSALSKSPLRFFPYGIGHFKAGTKTRAWVYCMGAAIALGVNITAYRVRKADENPDGTYDNAARAANLYTLQLTAFYGLFLGVGAVSFIDAWLNH
jgi:tetratricopeptide (TPR) repeat protein